MLAGAHLKTMPFQASRTSRSNRKVTAKYLFSNLSWIIICYLLLMQYCMAASQLMVTPTRIIFDSKTRSAKVSVINSGNEAGTYRISFVNKRMTEDGQFEEIKQGSDEDKFSENLVRFSPRQVVLKPGQSQVVRLSLRKPAKLADGEYRSHLLFQAIPKDAGNSIKQVAKSDKISIKLTPIVSISIPVIVRHGKTNAEVNFTAVKFKEADKENTKPRLLMELQRTGNQSIYGDLLAEFIQKDGGSSIIGQINGVAIYTPNTKRTLSLPVTAPTDVKIKNGVINVFYRSPQDQGGKVLSQTQIKVP